MIILTLFLEFLKIGAVSFGGGYGMIALIRETVLGHAWLTEEALLQFIAVAESTPGPIAVNMATFIGASQAGLPGSLFATLGVVLPSFVIILIIAALIGNLLRYRTVRAFMEGVRPCVVGMILATAVTIGCSTLFSVRYLSDFPMVDAGGLLIFAVLWIVHIVITKGFHRKVSPIGMILLSAAMGMLLSVF